MVRRMDLRNAPDDVRRYLVTTALNDLIDAPDARDLRHLLNLRQVSDEFKSIVDKACCEWAKTSLEKMSQAIKSRSVEALQCIGIHFLKAGICVIMPYASWTVRKYQEQEKKEPTPITFDTYLSWRRGFHSEEKFRSRLPRRRRT